MPAAGPRQPPPASVQGDEERRHGRLTLSVWLLTAVFWNLLAFLSSEPARGS